MAGNEYAGNTIEGGAFLLSRSVTGAVGVLPTSTSSSGASLVISSARYPYSPKLTIDDCLEAFEDLREPSTETLCTSRKPPDDFLATDPFLESADNFLGGVEAGDNVADGFLDPDIRLGPFSTIDILLSATNDGRRSSGTGIDWTGAADSRRRDRPIGWDLASGNEPVGRLAVGIDRSGEGTGIGIGAAEGRVGTLITLRNDGRDIPAAMASILC